MMGALGVVFGDIGTSPIYAFRETLTPHHLQSVTPEAIFSILSLIFWTITIIISIKYVIVIMRADNNGEGGTLALLARINEITKNPQTVYWATILGLWGTAFFFGDCMLTPAISVLSAVEGLKVVDPELESMVIPITVVVISLLFGLQQHGSGIVGRLFGPIMCVWFIVIALLGLVNIIKAPEILWALDPRYALDFFTTNFWQGFLVLGAVFLVVTGGEALYADMGHFGKKAIRLSWFLLVWPALLLNYFGQGALLLHHPEYNSNPFYLLAPSYMLLPLVILATAATIIASQAVITGAFSIFQQGVQLDYFPRIKILHTSGLEEGQIYLPFVNWVLYFAVLILVLFFKTSSSLAGAYGISVAGTMIISTPLVMIVMALKWNWPRMLIAMIVTPLFLIDLLYLSANMMKIPVGGWFSLVVGAICFACLSTWRCGRAIVNGELNKRSMGLSELLDKIGNDIRIRGTAVVLTANAARVPLALLHSFEHNRTLHEQIVVLTVVTEHIPMIERKHRLELNQLERGFYSLKIRYGFMQNPNIPRALAQCADLGLTLDLEKTSFLLRRLVVIPTHRKNMAKWRKHLFSVMTRNAINAVEFFHLPSHRVVELGVRIEI